jgi:tyrosyl-DNA phosphodiesterase 2
MIRFLILLSLFTTALFAEEAKDADKPTKSETLKLVTYNVLGDDVEVKKRIPALFKILKDSDADIIVLQEVAPWFFKLLVDEPWLKKYQLTAADEKNAVRGEYAILSKQKIESTVFELLPGKMHRKTFIARFKWNDRSLAVATAHLESYMEDGPMRAQQLDQIFGLIKDTDDAIFLGDFNFGDGEEPDSSHLDKKYVDAWLALKPKDPGYTWNIETSDMAKAGSFPKETSRRLDRILVRSEVWKPESVSIIGDKPVEEGKLDVFPSDHFGLTATLKFKPK